MKRWLIGLAFLAGCAAPVADGDDGGLFEVYRDTSKPIAAQAAFDADAYLGRWFEIARYPVVFERGCANVTADYGALSDGRISVINICRDLDGAVRSSIEGYADVVGPGQLAVTFPSIPFTGGADYWVLWVDPGYRVAAVGAPNGRSGWVLARSGSPDPDLVDRAKEALVGAGYDLNRLLSVPQAAVE